MPEIKRPDFQQGAAANQVALAFVNSSIPDFGRISNGLVWADVSRAGQEVSNSDHNKNKVQSWDTLEMILSNDFCKTVSTHFLFPRSAKPLFVKIIDQKGTLVREFNVSFPSAGPSFVRWNGKNINGGIVPPGDYMVKVLANNFEQAVRIVLERNN
jgi:flagellar hook assembly protein FlgD